MARLVDNIPEIQSFTGFNPSLFEVQFYTIGDTEKPINFTYGGSSSLYCTSYDIGAPTVKVEQNKLTKEHFITEYIIPEQVTITWQETEDLEVWRFHQNWVSGLYDRSKDIFVSQGATNGKKVDIKRKAIITTQKYNYYANVSQENLSKDFFTPNFIVTLEGLFPKNPYSLRGAWSDDTEKGSTGISIQYTVDYIKIEKGEGETNTLIGAL